MVRFTEELAAWLRETARRTSVRAGHLIRDQLDRVKKETAGQAFLRHGGELSGPANLSSRKGFARK